MSLHSRTQHGIISTVILICIALGLVAGSTYLYIDSTKRDSEKDLILEKARKARENAPQLTQEELQEHLASAQIRVGIETRKLEALTIRYALQKDDHTTSRNFLLKEFIKIQDTLLKTTDSFFKNPASTQPQLNLVGVAPSDKAFIQSQRALVNQILTEIIAKLEKLDPEKTTPEMMDAIIILVEKDIKIIQDYTENLTEIVQNLDPQTRLTQNQINTYEQAVETLSTVVEQTTEVVVPPTVIVTTDPGTEQTTSQTPVPTVPPVTEEQIATQTQVVEQAQTEVSVIELQIQQQQEESSSNTTTTSPSETGSSGGSPSSSSNGDTTTTTSNPNQGNGGNSGSASSSPSNGTYGSGSYYSALPDDDNALPPDAPKLIEGTNGF